VTRHDHHAMLLGMASGECRWYVRHDLHIYCMAPMVRAMMPHGRMGWQPGPREYRVVCRDAGVPLTGWIDADETVSLIESILSLETAR